MEYVFFAHRFQLFQRGLFFSRLPRIQLVEYVGGNLIFADVLHNPVDHRRMNRYSNSRHTAHLLLFVSFMIAYLWSEFYKKEVMGSPVCGGVFSFLPVSVNMWVMNSIENPTSYGGKKAAQIDY